MNFTLEKEIKDKGIVNVGDTNKIFKALSKCEKGEEVTIAFLGGSITQGCHARVHETSYGYRTYEWFKERFKDAKIKYINAGVGATGSVIGVHRVEKQVLELKPDLIFIDFAVNDRDDYYCKVAYESLIRKILLWPNAPGIIEVFMSLETLTNVQEQQIQIGKKYSISMISYKDVIKDQIEKGRFKWEDIEADEVHPNDNGHYIIMQLLTNFLEGVLNKSIVCEKRKSILGNPIFGDKYMKGAIINNTNTNVIKIEGFTKYEEGFQVFHNGWKCEDNGRLVAEVKGKNIFIILSIQRR